MMDGYDMGSGGWTMMIILTLVVVALVIWAVARIAPRQRETTAAMTERPREILDRRLARGEIDSDTYDKLCAKLAG